MNVAQPPKPSILVIDDDPNNLEAVLAVLDAYGFEAAIARTGERGLERARRLQPDLVLLDIVLPGIDGYEVCRRLTSHALTRPTPVIFMSALLTEDDKVRGFDVGAVDYVTKPVGERELLARVRAHLQIRSLRAQLEQARAHQQAHREATERELAGLRQTIEAQGERIRDLEDRLHSGSPRTVDEDTADPFASLSKRELQVTRMLVAGKSNKEIAYELSLSQTTISTHRTRVMEKLEVQSLPDLIKMALRAGVGS